MEKYERVANELGLAKESQVRELLQSFAGQEVDGRLLGLSGTLQLPVFERAAPYLSPDGQVQIDSVAESSAAESGDPEPGERWAVEIKWRGRLSGKKELEKLAANARLVSAKPWFISKSGFTPEAIDYARQNDIMFSNQTDLETLAKLVR